jgi:hypothetical protein
LQHSPAHTTPTGGKQANFVLDLHRAYQRLYGKSLFSGARALDVVTPFLRFPVFHGHTALADADDLAALEDALAERDIRLAFGF